MKTTVNRRERNGREVLSLQVAGLNSGKRLASYRSRLRKQGIVPQLAAVVLGATVCSAIGLWFVTEVFRGDVTSTAILLLAYNLFVIAYSVGASLTFQPKRFVSPAQIQVLVTPIIVILILDLIYRRGFVAIPNWDAFVSLYGILLAATMFLLLVVTYYVLSPTARSLVGLLGTKDDLLVKQFLVHAPQTKVLGVFIDADFQYALQITEQEEVRHNIWLFRTDEEHEQQLFVVICPDSENRDLTQVVVVSYELADYGIAPTTRARAVHELDAKNIKQRFQSFRVDEVKLGKSKLMPALAIAYESALACTESKILAIAKLPTRHKAIIVGTAFILVLIGILGWFGKISPDVTESALIFVGIAMLFEFFPLVAVKRGSRTF